MAQAREHFAGSGPDSVGRSWLGIRRLPGGFYGEHAERLERYGDGWHRGSALFLSGWTAMMVPATLPLILLYRHLARKRLSPAHARVGTVLLLVSYVGVWAMAGLPVFFYNVLSSAVGSLAAVLPALLLIVGGVYQFTPLKGICHARCSSPLFFLMQHWRPGATGALRLGVIHGIDCLGCCAGLMVGLVALGMMNLTWMLTAAVIIFVEKTIPGSHR